MDRKCETLIGPERAPVIKKMFEKVAYEHWSGKKVYNWLRFELNFRTEAGKKHLSLGNIFRVLSNTFYYGSFEYPRKSGNWYTGKHTPIITKELFDLVQAQVKSNIMRVENKEFAFTKMMRCGLCGSGISADEKFKKLKDGSVNRHVYYGCIKARDKNCKCGYINEEVLIKQIEKVINLIPIHDNTIKDKIKNEISRIKKFHQKLLGIDEDVKVNDIDVRAYMKFILKEGSVPEKREILSCIQGRLTLSNKEVKVIKN